MIAHNPGTLRQRFEWTLFGILSAGCGIDAWLLLNQAASLSPAEMPFAWIDLAVVLIGTVFLLGYAALHCGRPATMEARSCFVVGSVCGAIFFVRTLGTTLLDPGNTGWLMENDWAQHYSGWAMFRELPWTWPLGGLPALWYPIGTSIVYTDSLPLLALPLKLVQGWLPQPFQYIGLWLALSCVLQGAFGALLMRQRSVSPPVILAGCLLFIYAPILLHRIGHDTLTAHWLLLAALWLYFRRELPESAMREAAPWWLLILCASFVHPYLTAMVGAVVAAYAVRRVRVDRTRTRRESLQGLLIAALIVLSAWWISGAFLLRLRDGPAGAHYGVYTFNLLGFVNSNGFSRVMPSIPGVSIEQWEGFAYLGLGVIGLAVLLALEAIARRRKLQWPLRDWPLVVMVLLLIAYAASTVLTVGPYHLMNWSIKSTLLATFRSSGRFIWIPYYVILLTIVVQVLRVFPRAAAGLLIGAFSVQAWEFSPAHLHFAGLRSGWDWPKPAKMLNDSGWEEIVQARHHLTMLPPEACGKSAGSYLPFMMFAIEHHLTFNSGYIARSSFHDTQLLCNGIAQTMETENFSDDDIYILGPDEAQKLSSKSLAGCRKLDDYVACTFPPANPKAEPPADPR